MFMTLNQSCSVDSKPLAANIVQKGGKMKQIEWDRRVGKISLRL